MCGDIPTSPAAAYIPTDAHKHVYVDHKLKYTRIHIFGIRYAISTPVSEQYKGDGIAIRGISYNMKVRLAYMRTYIHITHICE